VIIGNRLRALREEKKLSQGDIEKRTGLIRYYVSRVENGHSIPSVETLEKFARALEARGPSITRMDAGSWNSSMCSLSPSRTPFRMRSDA
jgi:transcriptional regulator with XRE-family HTH domain